MSHKRKVVDVEKEDASISMQDLIAEDQEIEDTANAVLGASDDQECTYKKGYVRRQALFACYTCSVSQEHPAGVCLACSLECHDGHDLYELYTKRNFRCDCGNSKFSNLSCKLFSEKESTNEKNLYNQNFRGLYCTCSRPYPDEDDDVEDEMIQCVVCEDWFHGRHLGETTPPENLAFSEMICFECTKRCTFLHKYSALFIAPTKVEKDIENDDVNVTETVPQENGEPGNDNHVQKNTSPKIPDGDVAGVSCKVNGAIPVKITGASFWPSSWRSVLCKCKACLVTYNDLNVAFLLDCNDTVESYEEEGRKKALEEKEAQNVSALDGMSRFLQVEMLNGYQDMKEGFYEHFKNFAEEGKVVTEADVRKFFNNLKNKRQKVGMSYNCR